MDINKFISSNDQSVIVRFEKEGQPVQVGSFDDFLTLELPDCCKKRLEKDKVEDGSGTINHS